MSILETKIETMFDPELAETIRQNPIIAVLVIDDPESAVPLAKALIKGGISVIELTLRTPAAFEAAKRIKAEVPEMTLGFGTVINAEQVKKTKEVGAAFAVAPGLNVNVLKAARQHGLSFAPGIVTPSEIELAIEHGCTLMKFFPAETSGGLRHLKSMAGPYSYLNLRFIPLGGLNQENMKTYLADPLVDALGGSWIAPQALIQSGDWETITERAKQASDAANEVLQK
ncbi:MAG: bifunctional 4-hydroxy-2-oxoglutarate aldolase/2-dehydro-3-deoxy-phosphogluconate aldolase [Lentisphaeraceae bacterium]|nr:bifunctional 4-hydroxy-2-oxoglutarate aldolase/2-dehydro-3-deoxy-phosphogluconate aldolase [Lentisphaeraceae bacterium]